MTEAIIFYNPGEAELAAMTTFGVSVKESKNPIGFFGTGFKYAIAVLLRTGHEIEMYLGEDRYTFAMEERIIRGEPFEAILLLDHGVAGCTRRTDLHFTTQLGRAWEVWMAYRELVCNARDEDGDVHVDVDPDSMIAPDNTVIIVRGDGVLDAHQRRAEWFILSEPLAVQADGDIHPGPANALFYRGIRVHNLEKPSLFKYDLRNGVQLTEDRTAKDPHMCRMMASLSVMGCQERSIVAEAVTAIKEFYESDLDFDWGDMRPSSGWRSGCDALM